MEQRMDFLLADCLPLLSDHLGVIDLFRLESVSKQLQETIHHGGDDLFHRAIRCEVGYDHEYPATMPTMEFKDEKEAKRKRHSAKSYPAKLCFHAKLAHDGIVVEDLSVEKIRIMGKSMARFRDDLIKGAPTRETGCNDNDNVGYEKNEIPSSTTFSRSISSGSSSSNRNRSSSSSNNEEGPIDWDLWYSDGYLGQRGGYVYLDFKVVGGFVLVFSVKKMLKYKNEYGYQFYHGFLDEVNQTLHYALEKETIPLRSDDDIPYAYKPYSFYDQFELQSSEFFDELNMWDFTGDDPSTTQWERLNQKSHKIDIWCRIDDRDGEKSKFRWLRDSSDTLFAITLGKQLLTRKLKNGKHFSLTHDQGEIAKRFLAPHVWAGGATVFNANRMLGFESSVTLEEFEAIQRSLPKS